MADQKDVWAELAAKLPYKRTAEEKAKRMKLFDSFDPNGNGYLSLAEVDKGLASVLNCSALFDTKPVIMRAFQAAKGVAKNKSKYGDDFVERNEFRLLLQYLRQYFEYYVMFQRIDSSNDRRIDLGEFKAAVPMMEQWGVKIPNAEVAFNQIDKNHGGKILFDEFCAWAIRKNLDLEDDDD